MSLILSLLLPLAAAAAAPFHFIEVEGSINPGSASYILESVKAAESEGGQGIIIRLNTPGGLLSSTRDIIQGINSSSVPVVVYVAPGGASATSAGALITLSSHIAAMAPGTNIGAAHPVGSGGEEVKGPMGDKVTNDTAALARAQAVLRGRNPEAAERIVKKSESYSAEEAVKQKVVEIVANDTGALLKALDGKKVSVEGPKRELTLATKDLAPSSLVNREMNLRQKFLHLIADPNISALLIALGGLAIYAEISSGFATLIPGTFGLFCLLLGFVSLQTIPVNVGGAMLFALGLALLVAEAFVTSYGLLTLAALASLFLGGLFLVEPATTDMRVSLSLLIPMILGVGAIVGITAYLFYRDGRAAGSPQDQVVGQPAKVVQAEEGGLKGSAYVNGELWAFDSDIPLQPGEEAVVASVLGMRVQLKRRS